MAYGAGIGIGEDSIDEEERKITINGGNVKASAYDSGAAIGGSIRFIEGYAREITINGGHIELTAEHGTDDEYAAGAIIGGGYEGAIGKITVNGGYILMNSPEAALIGTGIYSYVINSTESKNNFIHINGGVFAIEGENTGTTITPKNAEGEELHAVSVKVPEKFYNKDIIISAGSKIVWSGRTYSNSELAVYCTEDISALSIKIKPADYTALNKAVANVPKNLSIYTASSAKALKKVIGSIDYQLTYLDQSKVDEYVKNVNKYVNALVLKINEKKSAVTSATNTASGITVK